MPKVPPDMCAHQMKDREIEVRKITSGLNRGLTEGRQVCGRCGEPMSGWSIT